MKKKPPAPRRPQEATQRFDRLRAAIAPKVDSPQSQNPREREPGARPKI
jgi:hypothetical protein